MQKAVFTFVTFVVLRQGDGTASIFGGNAWEEGVWTMSMHCESNFPFQKAKSHLDVALQDHISDRQVVSSPPCSRASRPS